MIVIVLHRVVGRLWINKNIIFLGIFNFMHTIWVNVGEYFIRVEVFVGLFRIVTNNHLVKCKCDRPIYFALRHWERGSIFTNAFVDTTLANQLSTDINF